MINFFLTFLYPITYSFIMNEIILSEQFIKWLYALKDKQARNKILQRIERAKENNFGDYKQLTENYTKCAFFMVPATVFIIPKKIIRYILFCLAGINQLRVKILNLP